MQKKIFDAVTAKKIISDYADKINNYMKENNNLKCQLEDLRMTLNINKELLFKYISTNVQQTEQITLLNDYRNDNLRLLEKNEKLHNDKTLLEKKLYRVQQDSEDNLFRLREELEKIKEDNFLLKNKLTEKETLVIYMRKEMDKLQSGGGNNPSVKELYVTEPTKVNVDIINELNFTRELIGKVSKLLNVEKVKNEKFELKVKSLSEQLEMLKKMQGEKVINIKDDDSQIKVKKQESIVNSQENKFNTEAGKETEVLDSLSMFSDDDMNTLDEGQEIESPAIKFPDKVNYNSNSSMTKAGHGKSHSLVPKLNLQIIQNKYDTNSKAIQQNLKKPTQQEEAAKVLDKAKLELKMAQNTIKELKSRIEKYKKAYKDVKLELRKEKEHNKNTNSRLEVLENQLKKFIHSASTEDTASNKRIHSMTNNTGRSLDEYDHYEIKSEIKA